MKRAKGYFGMGYLLSVVFAIIPLTNLFFGVIIRLERNKFLHALLNILLFPLFWLVDLLSIVLYNKLKYLV